MASILGLYPNGRSSATMPDDIDDLSTSSSSTSSSSTNSAMPTPLSSTSVSGIPPGPEYYEERRRMWLGSPDFDSCSGSILQRRSEASTTRNKLETLLTRRGGGADEEAWHSGVKSVYEGLMSGGRLKRRLPLNIVIKVLKAGWMHDGTWPDSMPDPVPSPQLSSTSHLPPT